MRSTDTFGVDEIRDMKVESKAKAIKFVLHMILMKNMRNQTVEMMRNEVRFKLMEDKRLQHGKNRRWCSGWEECNSCNVFSQWSYPCG